MIIGNGLIASAFTANFARDPDVIIFASGVSNSREARAEAFSRERILLTDALTADKRLYYFSTCSINDPELCTTAYVVHKRAMEAIVLESQKSAIFRLPQVVGRTPNPNTLTNYLYNQIRSGERLKIWRHAYRNLIDIDDVAVISTQMIKTSLDKGEIVNIACPFSISVLQLVGIFEQVLGKQANYDLVEAGGSCIIDSSRAAVIAKKIGINFDQYYPSRLIRKYYAP